MNRIDIDDKTFRQFEDYRADEDGSRALGRLIRFSAKKQQEEAERLAIVILEAHWFDLDDNPGQASNAPFLEGVCRLADNAKSYRLNFYDANSFGHALDAIATISETRIILYIGAHGSKAKVAAAHATTLMKKVADFSRKKKKIEGIVLSSCLAGGHDPAMVEALSGSSNWIFGYRTAVDFLGSIQVESAILAHLAAAGPGFSHSEEDVVEVFGNALHCFNPHWEIGMKQYPRLVDAFRLITRGKHMKNVTDRSQGVIDCAWPQPAPPVQRQP
ncbi:hypothetical protein [Massilia phyllosphaerae]|uniref:hypothetical protein n=1 Tax=Massilia phyllosphaerae TaxID=3106034 RepID=UPI002B1CAB97|nr:hypothetical protein [Massilia sp. SGZ-792]